MRNSSSERKSRRNPDALKENDRVAFKLLRAENTQGQIVELCDIGSRKFARVRWNNGDFEMVALPYLCRVQNVAAPGRERSVHDDRHIGVIIAVATIGTLLLLPFAVKAFASVVAGIVVLFILGRLAQVVRPMPIDKWERKYEKFVRDCRRPITRDR